MMRFDCDITASEIQQLAGADAVAAFFAKLGYRTDVRVPQTPGNLGITADGTVRPIKRVELIADQEGLLQIYLFELSSVTVTHTRALARAFRNRAGNYLLVLTSDYDHLDFVLVEKYLPTAGPATAIGQAQVGVRPRMLTVERRKPGRVELRVLRRFTYTESDPLAQYDKMLSAYAIADWSEEFFNNRALFSDYYLLERLRDRTEWAEDPKPAYAALQELYRGASSRLTNQPEERVRADLLEPVFKTLGFVAKTGKKSASAAEEPDYRLFGPDAKDKPLALCLAYPWGRSLDGKDDQRDKETPEENPGAVVVSALEKGEAQWAVVTNGKVWRLYSARAHSRATNYYEIDLEEALSPAGPQGGSPAESFRYFWLLFRRKALEPATVSREGREQSLSFLDLLLAESEDYAKELGERLKERVFKEVFPHLAEGFLASIRKRDGKEADLSQAALDEVFRGTLTLLYRLLFLLYAESRDLLPAKEVRGYFDASLRKLSREMAEAAGTIADEVEGKLRKAYRDDSYALYDRLARLFAVVDRGDPALNVPVYNGGLFLTQPQKDDDSPEAHAARFLNTTKVSDRDLACALNHLVRDEDPKRHDLVFIDFKSLGVRQLGSIYEGLLEFKVRIAPHKLAVTKEKGREVYVLFADLDEREQARAERTGNVVKKGAAYLENDKHERKATGSYYTPDYIVKYIVEHAVGPVLEEKFKAVRPLLRQAQQERAAFFKQQEAFRKQGMRPKPDAQADLVGREVVDELFDLKVLDPAMGSGHFLVEAVDFITDRTLTFLAAFPWNPVLAHLGRMRETILAEMDEQGIAIDPKRLTDVNLLKRQVLKRCTYGVDLNPMAVELAKVSLWLDCFTLGAPLSFLDHHLRCGNSLIGITVEEVREALSGKGQMGLFGQDRFAGVLMATDLMRHVGELSDVTSAQVQESRREYHRASEALVRFKRILDIYTSRWFGNTPQKTVTRKKRRGFERITDTRDVTVELLGAEEIEPVLNASPTLMRSAIIRLEPDDQRIATTAIAAASDKRFFHWELEFPEVFYGPSQRSVQKITRLEDGGFDAVVGNPPYVQERRGHADLFEDLRASPLVRQYCEKAMDIFNLFVVLAKLVGKPQSGFGMIVPIYWTDRDGASLVRGLLQDLGRVRIVIDFGEFPVFEEATGHHSSILILSPRPCAPEVHCLPPNLYRATSLEVDEWLRTPKMPQEGGFLGGVFVIGKGRKLDLVQRLLGFPGQRLSGRLDLSQGMVLAPDRVGDHGVFVLSTAELDALNLDPNERALFLPFYYPQEVQRYKSLPETPSFYVLFTEKESRSKMATNPRRYGRLIAHLRRYEREMTSSNKPYGPHRTRKRCYFEGGHRLLGRRKVTRPEFTVTSLTACVDENFCIGMFEDQETAYAALGILNSSVAAFLFRNLKTHGDQMQIDVGVIEKIPLPIAEAKNAGVCGMVSAILGSADGSRKEQLIKNLDSVICSVFGLTSEEASEVQGT